MVLATPGVPVTAGVASARAGGLGLVEPDARTVPWTTIERLVLEAGLLPPAYRPLSEQELAALLDDALARAMAGQAPGLDDDELDLLRWWRDRYAGGGWAPTWIGCACKVHPPRVRGSGRALVGWQELGDPLADEAGLDWSGGRQRGRRTDRRRHPGRPLVVRRDRAGVRTAGRRADPRPR